MNSSVLLEPKKEYKRRYLEFCAECENDELSTGFITIVNEDNFENEINMLNDYSKGIGLHEGWVPESTFWLYNKIGDKIVGVASIRHHLSKSLEFRGGHIGYYIRPSERRKGFATKLLELSLEKCKEFGITRVLITCSKSNIGSAKAIINNGGILHSEDSDETEIFQRFWINL